MTPFLSENIDVWNASESFQRFKAIISSFDVMNDVERSISFGTDFTGFLTKKIEFRHNFLQTVELSSPDFSNPTRLRFLGEVSASSSTVDIMEKT